jgi:hypothetical protein
VAITLAGTNTFSFNDGNAGHLCDFGSAPTVGQWDVLCVNSDTTVSTPIADGFALAESAVANQGSYIFTRKAAGGELGTVTITTTGNFNTQVSWLRFDGADALDTSTSTQANASIGGATPAHSTGVMAAAGEACIAFGAMSSIGTANQNTPVWGTFTPATSNIFGSGASGILAYTAYKTPVGTAAETPQVSWSGDGASNRYMLTITLTAVASTSGTASADLGALTATASGAVAVAGTAASNLGALTATASGLVAVTGTASSDLGRLVATAVGTAPAPAPSPVSHLQEIMDTLLACLCEAAASRPGAPQHCCYRVGQQVAHDADMFTDLCCEGLAYVSLGEIYPVVDSFPEQSIVTQANQVCSFPSWAVSLKAGIVRCVPTMGETELSMPSCTDWNTAVVQQIYDVQSLAEATCCFKQTWYSDQPGMSVVIGPNSSTDPEGGCVERFVTLQVQTTVCPDC